MLAGERSCLPHQTGGANRLNDDDLMYFEISASQHRYTAALMRTIFVGNPKDEWVRAAEACIGAVEAALETIKPGITPHEADTAARAVTQKAGFVLTVRYAHGERTPFLAVYPVMGCTQRPTAAIWPWVPWRRNSGNDFARKSSGPI